MTILAVYRGVDRSLSTDRLLLQPDEVIACEAAVDLLGQLQQQVSTSQQQLELAMTQARAQGYEAGRAEALDTVGAKLVEGWSDVGRQAQVDAQALRQALVLLSRQIVQRIAAEVGPPDFVAALALRAVESMVPQSRVVIRVHPLVDEVVRRHMAQHARPDSETRLEVRPDSSLGEFDCVIDTPHGQLLAGLQNQLDRVAGLFGGSGGSDTTAQARP